MSKIFGGSKSKSQQTSSSVSSSSNQAFPQVQSAFMPGSEKAFNESNQAIGRELDGGFDEYKNKSGFDFMKMLGLRKVGGSYAGRGAFQSGAAMKRLAEYEGGLNQQAYGSYLDQLFKRAQIGLGGGQVVSGAGNVSSSSAKSQGTSMSKSSPGIGQFIGQIASGFAASDRRLKQNIVRISELPNGLPVYQYEYIDGRGPFIGVMADEVETIMPEALGPVIDGYKTVDYDKVWETE